MRVSTCRLKKVNESIKDIPDEIVTEDEHLSTEKIQDIPDEPVIEITQEAGNQTTQHVENTNVDHGSDATDCSNKNINLKKGDHIRFRKNDDEEWHVVEVTGNAGKKTGKNRDWYNVVEGENKYSVDVSQLRDLSIEEQTETVNIVMVPRRDHDKPGIREAKEKELQAWKDLGVYEEVPDVGQPWIQTNWLVTEKDTGYKSRLVVRGDQEMCNVKGDSPTVSKLGIRIFLAISAAESFDISTKDVTRAFLQGKSIERTVYVNPPSEAKKPFIIWKLKKAAYGLGDAARNWYDSVLREVVEIGCKKSTYEDALFYFKENDKLLGLITTHVDDFLNGGNLIFKKKVLDLIDNKFDFGKECEMEFRYVGINMRQENGFIEIDQNHFINALEEINVVSKDQTQLLSEPEKKLFRGIVGSINWVSLISRPDISFEVVDLSTKFQAPTVGDMILANKAVRKIKNTNFVLKYQKLKINDNLKLIVYSDGSFRNLCNGVASGSGRIIFLVDEDGKCCPITWNSNKLKKIVDSTLAAESMSLSAAVKETIYIQQIIKELLGERSSLPIYCVVDSRGARDAVYSTKLVEDRITRLYIADIKQCLESNAISKVIHVPGTLMLADCLTKRGASNKLLLQVLQDGVLPDSIMFFFYK